MELLLYAKQLGGASPGRRVEEACLVVLTLLQLRSVIPTI